MTARWEGYLEEHQDQYLSELMDLLRIPSVSTKAELKGEVRRAAVWVAERMARSGIEQVAVMETGGHPVVFGQWLHAPGKPTLLFYGHFDVQPEEPVALWTSPPFEPTVRDGRLWARGAADMKGSALLPLIACEALLQTEGTLPVNVKFLFEGEEEIGSPSLGSFISAHKELLACDFAVSADGGNDIEGESPAVPDGARGLCALQINLRTANTDLHSGTGGMAPNPIHALVRLLDSMRAPDGTITVKGFHDQVRPLSEADRAHIAKLATDPEQFRTRAGIKELFGDPNFTPVERNVARPTLEVNGIWGGFNGDGIKTVIPCEAHAKITCRLVPDQDPESVRRVLIEHIKANTPSYADVTIDLFPGDSDPYLVPTGHAGQAALERVLTGMTGKPVRYSRSGGTVPVMGMLLRHLGVATVTMGAADNRARAHAPDESLSLGAWRKSQTVFVRYLQEVGR